MKRNKQGEFLEFAKTLAKRAGKILLDDFKKERRFKEKDDGTLVTETDLKSEKFIKESIRKKYPDHSILAEESGVSKGDSEYTWFIDPLDGTHNFIYGIPLFGVSIAVSRKKDVILGVIYLPFFDWMYHAEKGRGAYFNGERVHVSRKHGKESLLLHDSTFTGKEETQMRSIERLLHVSKRIRMFGAATINFTFIASGAADIYVERTSGPHDIAAGCLITEEAGGKVTEISGKPWSLWSKDLVATNGKFHDKVIEILNR